MCVCVGGVGWAGWAGARFRNHRQSAAPCGCAGSLLLQDLTPALVLTVSAPIDSLGLLPALRERELMMGMKMPPARAVVDGMAGAMHASATAQGEAQTRRVKVVLLGAGTHALGAPGLEYTP